MRLSLVAHVPVVVLLPVLLLFAAYEKTMPLGAEGAGGLLLGLVQMATNFLSAAFIVGMTALLVTQLHVAPLRPLRLRTALAVLRRRLRPYLKTSLAVTLRIMLGYVLLVVPGLVMTVRYAVYGPVILLEGLEGKAARLRARALAGRSWRTVIALTALQLCIPMIIGAVTGALAGDQHANTNGQVVFSVRGLAGLICAARQHRRHPRSPRSRWRCSTSSCGRWRREPGRDAAGAVRDGRARPQPVAAAHAHAPDREHAQHRT